jgi:hypothetical protein
MPNGKLICSFRVPLFVDTRPRRPDKVAPRFDRLTLMKRPRRNDLREPNGMRLIILYSFSRLGWRLVLSTVAASVCMMPGGHIGLRRVSVMIEGFSVPPTRIPGDRSGGSTTSMITVSALVILPLAS